jgi:hypothetical protein
MASSKGRDVVPDGKGAAVKKPGAAEPESRHRTQRAAEAQAKKAVRAEGGGEVRIHGRDGAFRDSDTIGNADDPNPPRDRKR